MRLFYFLALLLALAVQAQAQPLPPDHFASGRLYYLVFPDTAGNLRDPLYPDNRFVDAATVMVYSATANRIRITTRDGRVNWTRTIPGGQFTTLDLMATEFRSTNSPLSSEPGPRPRGAYRLQADSDVVVYCYMMTVFGTESWTPLPVEAWGNEYFAEALPGDIVRNTYPTQSSVVTKAQPAPSEIVIVAAYDSTQVVVLPNAPYLGSLPLVTLMAGEAWQLRSFVDTSRSVDFVQPDLAGSQIVASKPIGVISGNTRTAIYDEQTALTKNSYKNLAVEWLTPTDMHGTRMVSTPCYDQIRITGQKGEVLTQKRKGEMVKVYGTTDDTARGELSSPVEGPRPFTLGKGMSTQIRTDGLQSARLLTSSSPVQATISPMGLLINAGGGATQTAFDSWSGYSVELVPLEQWTSFAPYFPPNLPVGIRSYINVVADSDAIGMIYTEEGRRFQFNGGVIPGTTLVWGTVEVTPGITHYLEGREGAKFTATLYGLLKGTERTVNRRYQEQLGISYGNALAPARRALRLRDTLRVNTTRDCSGMRISVTTTAEIPQTIRSITLIGASNVTFQPTAVLATPMLTPQTLTIAPVDRKRDASCTIRIEDRSGTVVDVPYTFAAENASFSAGTMVNFGEMMAGDTTQLNVDLVNSSSAPLRITSLALAGRIPGLRLDGVPNLPYVLPVGQKIPLTLSVRASGSPGLRSDSIVARFDCTTGGLPIALQVVEPCLTVGDLDFGTVLPGELVTRTLSICNQGRGRLSLLEVATDSILSWGDPDFRVNAVYQQRLRNSVLAPGECVSVDVFFNSTDQGRHRTVAHMTPSAGSCLDSSVWIADVQPNTGVRGAEYSIRTMLASIDPNPASDRIRIALAGAGARHARIDVLDTRGEVISTIHEGSLPSGRLEIGWSCRSLPSGVYCLRLTDATGSSLMRFVVRR